MVVDPVPYYRYDSLFTCWKCGGNVFIFQRFEDASPSVRGRCAHCSASGFPVFKLAEALAPHIEPEYYLTLRVQRHPLPTAIVQWHHFIWANQTKERGFVLKMNTPELEDLSVLTHALRDGLEKTGDDG